MWNSDRDLLQEVYESHERLKKSNDVDQVRAKAEARLFLAATRVITISMEHARLTQRLRNQDDVLPIMKFAPKGK